MRKTKLSICALVCAALLCLGACEGETPKETDTSAESTAAPPAVETTDAQTEPPKGAERVQLQLSDGKELKYRIVYSSALGEDGRESVKQLVLDLNKKIGTQPKIVSDTAEASADVKEIIVGKTSRDKTVAPKNYADYGIKTYSDGTIAIYGGSGIMLNKACDTLLNGINKMQDGNYYYRGYEYLESSLSDFLATLPVADFGNVETVYESHRNVYQVSINGATADNMKAYGKTLTDAGYTLHSENKIDADNLFATYKSKDNAVHVGYHKSNGTVEIIFEKLGYLPPASAVSAQKKVNASITQMKTDKNGGMGYVVQLIDGSFVVVDGGVASSAYSKELIELLEAKNAGTGYSKPQVTWMFTHSHPDHIQLAQSFITQYASRFELVMMCTNFIELNTEYSQSIGDTYSFSTLMGNAKAKFPNVSIFTYHTGQALYLAGCKIDFYLTHEDVYPTKLGTLNSASSVWKMTFDGKKSFMILGDTTETGAALLNSYYGATLRSDIMQAAHHGVNASNGTASLEALYANIAPTTVMWANSDESSVKAFAANSELLAKQGLVSIYSTQTKSLDIK